MEIKNLVRNLEVRGFKVLFAENAEDAKNLILNLIPTGESSAFGGSATTTKLGLATALKNRGDVVYHRSFFEDSERNKVLLDGMHADWYISSTNALTEGGEFINTDGIGNRIASQLFGGKNTLFVVGINKIVKDLDEGFLRLRNIAAKENCIRLGYLDNPCVVGGSCDDCKTENTICNATTIIHHPTRTKNFFVVLINENLGY
ncbi:MAG: lactate utilization protein [Clostridia bacterium]